MNTYSCPAIDNLHLNIYGRIDKDEPVITLCCEEGGFTKPGVLLRETAEDTLAEFLELHRLLVAEGLEKVNRGVTGPHIKECEKCDRLILGEHRINDLISRVNLSMYPAPCQCRCEYCYVPKKWVNSKKVTDAYDKLFSFLELAEQSGMIRDDASWTVATGEITIHPYKDRIMKLLEQKRVSFHTNVFIFDEAIAANLHNNIDSRLNFSIDSGTSGSWKKVKGVDNFTAVVSNLEKYCNYAIEKSQILLKYIIIPGINDTEEDYNGIVDIMNRLELSHLIISRDNKQKYSINSKEQKKLIDSAAHLLNECKANYISVKVESTYTIEEQEILSKVTGLNKPVYKQYDSYRQDCDF